MVKILLFLSVVVVVVVDVLIRYYYLSSYSWNMNLSSNEHPVSSSSSSVSLCSVGSRSVSKLNVESSKVSQPIVSLHNLFTVPVHTGFGEGTPTDIQTYRISSHQ